jgi:hypothetical protein
MIFDNSGYPSELISDGYKNDVVNVYNNEKFQKIVKL